jgi:hypothetical protein
MTTTTYHIIQEVTFSSGKKKLYAHCLNKNETVDMASKHLDSHEKIVGYEIVKEINTTDFQLVKGRAINLGESCSMIERRRNKKALNQFMFN